MSGRRIGYACLWDHPNPVSTWSYTPWNLREALRRRVEVVDVGVQIAPATQLALKSAHARWRGGGLTTTWRHSRVTDAYCHRAITRAAAGAGLDAILQIQDLAAVDQPFFVYQDMSYDALLHLGGALPVRLTQADVKRRQERQHAVYQQATGVIAMSHWLARSLVDVTGLPPERVHVVHPGSSSVGSELMADRPLPERVGPRHRLLFVGRDLLGKGGDLVLAALAILRREVNPAITLTVAGPAEWPLPGEVPDGVAFLGLRPPDEVARLYDEHDLFVMPSRLEGFGIVFAEALARGLPCIGRDDYAMPEIIEPGTGGALLAGDDPAELAALIAGVLDDDQLYANCRQNAPKVVSWFSWDRAAGEFVDIIEGALGGR